MDENVCVVTQPLGDADTTATREMLQILSAITSVSLVTIALADDTLREEFDVVEIDTRIPSQNVLVAAAQFLVNQIRMSVSIRRRDEMVVLFFGSVAYVLPILVARLSGKRVVVEPRANTPLALRLRWEQRMPKILARLLSGIVWTLERVSYRLAHGIVTYTPGMAAELDLERFESKLHPVGARFVDTDRFRPHVPYRDRDAVAGYVGRMDEEKGIRTMVEVARHLPRDVKMRFVGDGALSEWVATELQERIDEGSVELEGWVEHDRIPAELSKCRLLVLPSHPTEGLPTTILEAFACGTPVYATPVAGVTDVVQEGETGLLIEMRDPEAIAGRIESAVSNEALAAMSRRCRQTIKADYTFEAAVDRYRGILDSVVE